MDNKINSLKLFDLIDPKMYGVIMLSLRSRMNECREHIKEAFERNGGDLNDDMVCYWVSELQDAEYTYNRLP